MRLLYLIAGFAAGAFVMNVYLAAQTPSNEQVAQINLYTMPGKEACKQLDGAQVVLSEGEHLPGKSQYVICAKDGGPVNMHVQYSYNGMIQSSEISSRFSPAERIADMLANHPAVQEYKDTMGKPCIGGYALGWSPHWWGPGVWCHMPGRNSFVRFDEGNWVTTHQWERGTDISF